MVWFRVDDGFPTSRKVVQIPRRRRAAAIGVWTLAGAWSAHELTDGFIPRSALEEIPDGKKCAADLVSVDLWHYTDGSPMPGGCFPDGCPIDPRWIPEGGWLFHDWPHYQPSKREVTAKRSTNAARQQAFRERRNAERTAVSNALQGPLRNGVTNAAPTRPDPTQSVVPTELLEERRDKRGSRLPENWQPTPDLIAKALAEFPSVDLRVETDAFSDWWHSKAGKDGVKLDWDLTWQGWMRRTHQRNLERKPAGRRTYGGGNGQRKGSF